MAEPILISIAAALAAKSVQSVYDFVKTKFANRKEAKAALEAAEGRPEDSIEVKRLATHLELAELDDPKFAENLRQLWTSANQTGVGGTVINNSMSGTSQGPVIQIGQMGGGITQPGA
ncbi:hypothetical protein [Actinocrispum sp. NPDC049592]|uniref:hypothetical protein n=1 Tax=Actinocrispum sp. NPDC049592 TaxID=3154835 RepID=UPI003426133B